MKRNEIIDLLILEGFSEKTLSRMRDKELITLSKTVLVEQSTYNTTTGKKTTPVTIDSKKTPDVGSKIQNIKSRVPDASFNVTEEDELDEKMIPKKIKPKKPIKGNIKTIKPPEPKKEIKKYKEKKTVKPIKPIKGQPSVEIKDVKPKTQTKKTEVDEKWNKDVKIKQTGENTKQTIAQLEKEKTDLKKKSESYQEKGKKVPENIKTKIQQKNFAIRAKGGWKKDSKNKSSEIEEWVVNLAEENFSQFTSKREIMEIITKGIEESNKTMLKPKTHYHTVPEFMTYDSITGGESPEKQPGTPAPETIPGTPTREPAKTPIKTPYQPGPGTNPKPKALREKEKK